MGEQETESGAAAESGASALVRHDLLAGPAFEPGEEPGGEAEGLAEGLAEHSSAIKSGSEGEEGEHEPGEEPGAESDQEPGGAGERHPVGVIYGRRVVLAWNISEGMDIFVQGKLISSERDPDPKWLIVVWNEGRLVMRGTVFSGKQWVVKIAQKLRNAATCKALGLRVKRAAKKQRLGEGEAEGLAEGLAEHSSAIKSGIEGPGNTAGREGTAGAEKGTTAL